MKALLRRCLAAMRVPALLSQAGAGLSWTSKRMRARKAAAN